jgi:hypothetical protein
MIRSPAMQVSNATRLMQWHCFLISIKHWRTSVLSMCGASGASHKILRQPGSTVCNLESKKSEVRFLSRLQNGPAMLLECADMGAQLFQNKHDSPPGM